MRDVNAGYILRYTHANVASFFFIFVYAHIARGLFYSSYREPRTLVWTIGVIIFIVMMAIPQMWPNCEYDYTSCVLYGQFLISSELPFNKANTKAILRIGPHNKQILDIIICGMLGDFWGDKISGKYLDSVRFNIEQSISHSAYIHSLTLHLYNLGYCARPIPILVEKSTEKIEKRFNYRLTLFTFTNLFWIYESFYSKLELEGKIQKRVPLFISDYLSPLGLAHWIMQDGSFQKGQGVNLATNSFTYDDCIFLANLLNDKYNLKTSVIKTGLVNQWTLSIWKRSMPSLVAIVTPYIINEMRYKLNA